MDPTDPNQEQRQAMAKLVVELTRTRDILVQLSLTLQDFQFEHDARARVKTAQLAQEVLEKAKAIAS
jgi:hypothetical protein